MNNVPFDATTLEKWLGSTTSTPVQHLLLRSTLSADARRFTKSHLKSFGNLKLHTIQEAAKNCDGELLAGVNSRDVSQYSKSHNRVTKKVYILAVCTTMTKTSKRDELGHEGKALLDILLELGQASIEQFLFLRRDRTNRVDLVNTVKLCTNVSITRIINYRKVVRTPSSTFDEKKSMPWSAKRGDLTKVGVITPFSPFKPLNSRLVNLAPA